MWSQVGLGKHCYEQSFIGGDGIPVELFQILKDDAVKVLYSICQQIMENSAVGFLLRTGKRNWKRSVFIPIPKKGNAKEYSNYHTVVFISHASKVMLKTQVRLKYMNRAFPNVQAGFRKGRGARGQIANIRWIIKKKDNYRKTSASLTTLKPLTVWIATNCGKFLKEMGIPDHLTCLLRNQYVGQEATVRTKNGTIDWFQIGKGVCQGCILSPCLFNFYAEYIMWNARLEDPQVGIKIATGNVSNLRYVDDTT